MDWWVNFAFWAFAINRQSRFALWSTFPIDLLIGLLGAQKANQEVYWIGGSKSICTLDFLVGFFWRPKEANQEVYWIGGSNLHFGPFQ